MNLGFNLSNILKKNNISRADAAKTMGISVNTLSNIMNEKVEPSEDTRTKILNYLKPLGYTADDLDNSEAVIPNLRLKSLQKLSGLEKAIVRESLNDIIGLIKQSDNVYGPEWIDYFDRCDRFIDDEGNMECLYDRRERVKEELQNTNETLAELTIRLHYEFRDNRLFLGCVSPVEISEWLDQLGIRVFKISINSEKIAGFCTSFFDTTEINYEANPLIVINSKVCNTAEKYLFEMAKQFYYMIKRPSDFHYESTNRIEVEDSNLIKQAEKYAEDIMIPVDYVNKYLEAKKGTFQRFSNITKKDKKFFLRHYDLSYPVNRIKRDFNVSYSIALKQLLKSDFEYSYFFDNYKEAEEFYFECLKRNDKELAEKITYRNGEPEPLSWDWIGIDAAKSYLQREE